MPFLHSRQTAIATATIVAILFAALFFIVTTVNLDLLYLQLSLCATIGLSTICAWGISSVAYADSAEMGCVQA